jgi:hypothetical protein
MNPFMRNAKPELRDPTSSKSQENGKTICIHPDIIGVIRKRKSKENKNS